MRKTFKYRLYPTHKQTTCLNQTLEGCCWLYNYLLEQRKTAWETEKKNIYRYDQNNELKILKKEQPILNNIYSQVLQDVSTRIDLAFRSFFKRVKQGSKPGYPRFKSKFRYNSFCYPQKGFKFFKNTIQLSKIGNIKIKLHRPIVGIIKTCTIKQTSTKKWFVSFVCEISHTPIKQPINPTIGIDMGLESFATLSNSEKIENPRFFREEEKALKKAQQKFSKKEKYTKARYKARKIVARIHERINWKRSNFCHQESHKIINEFNTVVVEDLSINNMRKSNLNGINKSIGDAAWRKFLNMLDYKAEWAGCQVIKINPAYTSQICSQCHNRHKLDLSDRMYHCPYCGLSLNRDVNAALNILAMGTHSLTSV
jgi:putative transposase